MTDLLFISNELLSRKTQYDMRLPLEFVSFALIDAKLYKHFRNQSTFALPSNNAYTYGGLFVLKDANFYYRILDAYHLCSLSTLGKNHKYDVHHRITDNCTPISFNKIDEFERLMYHEHPSTKAQMYIGNKIHPKINQRLTKTNSYRIKQGFDKHLSKLIREEVENE